MADLTPITYLTKDYEGFRADLINLIPAVLPEWTDFSDSDPGIALIELFAYIGDILSYYGDRQANENYLPTALQKQSVIDLCSSINYRLKTAVPSSTKRVTFQITPQVNDYKIAKGFQISTQDTPYSPAIVFETDADLIIPAGKVGNEVDGLGNYLYTVSATQGITISNEVLGSSTNLPNQKFTLKNANVIVDGPQGSSLNIYINNGSNLEAWTDVTDSISPFTSDGKQYTYTIDANNFLTVRFGDGSTGNIPPSGSNNILTTYRIGGGSNTNVGIGMINTLVSTSLAVRSVTNLDAASGGLDAETIDHAKAFAPLALRTNNRAVTAQDYITLANEVSGVAFAQAGLKNGQANTVYVTVAPVGGGVPTTDLLNSVYSYLNDRKTITTTLTMQSVKYSSIMASITAVATTGASNAQVQADIQQALSSLLGFSASNFGKNIYISAVYQALTTVSGLDHVSLDRLTINPRVDAYQSTGNPTWSAVTVKTTNSYAGLWKVQMTDATNFTVYYNPSGDGTTWVSDGTGTFGTLYNSSSATTGISFTLSAGAIPAANGDYWQFSTSYYLGNIITNSEEIPILDANVIITVTGGVS